MAQSGEPSNPTSRHQVEYDHIRAYIQRKTWLGKRWAPMQPERAAVIDQLARDLLRRLRAQGIQTLVDGQQVEAQEIAFSEMMFEHFLRDDRVRWLVTDALIQGYLFRTNRDLASQDSQTARGEKLQEVRGRAWVTLDGGRYPTRKYQEKLEAGKVGKGGTFWKYLRSAIQKKTDEPFRLKSIALGFWGDKSPIDASNSDDEGHCMQLSDSHRIGERALARAARHQARLQALEQLRHIALRGASPRAEDGAAQKPDPNCVVMLKYIDWLLEHSDDESVQNRQAEFARAHGYPTGTVGAALKRFREKYGFDARTSQWRIDHLYTTTGGSPS